MATINSINSNIPIEVSKGGTAATTLTGVLTGNGTSAITANAVTQYGTVIAGASNAVSSVAPSATVGTPLVSGGAAANPSYSGIVNLPTTTSSVGQYQINGTRAFHTYGTDNTFVGASSGNFTLTGVKNVSVGPLVLPSVSSGSNNIGIGREALAAVTTSTANIGVGFGALASVATATGYNVAIGDRSLLNLATGNFNVSIGGNDNAIGYNGSESSNIIINNSTTVVPGESNVLRIGQQTNAAGLGLQKAFIHGIYGITAAGTTSSIPVIDSNGQLSTGAPAASTIGFSTDANTATINLGTGAAVKTVTLGSTNTTSATTVQSGSGALNITSTGGAQTHNSGTGAMGISTDASATTISIGTGGAVKTITMGSTNTTSTTTVTSGSGGVQIGTFLNLPTTTSTVGQIKINSTPVLHTFGTNNTFLGASAGNLTNTGQGNIVAGVSALNALTSGSYNTALGYLALNHETTGAQNIAIGATSLYTAVGANTNISIGYDNMRIATTAAGNVVIGHASGNSILTGVQNCILGYQTGQAYVGAETSNVLINAPGTAAESNACHIGSGTGTGAQQLNKTFIHGIFGITTGATGVPVVIDNAGQLGTVVSSIRYKENVQDMADVSSDVLKLRPVTFDYKGKPNHRQQVGLIAEEVYEVMPGLVIHNQEGQIETVKYQDLSVLLLNELQKAIKRIEVLEAKVGK